MVKLSKDGLKEAPAEVTLFKPSKLGLFRIPGLDLDGLDGPGSLPTESTVFDEPIVLNVLKVSTVPTEANDIADICES